MPDPDTPVLMNFGVLTKILVDRQYQTCTWPKGDDGKDSPVLVVDMTTANIMLAIHTMLGSEMKAKFERMIAASSVQFHKVHEFCMERALQRGVQNGGNGHGAAISVAAKLKR